MGVTPECLDADWPLTVESAEVYCTDESSALVRVEGQGVSPLNGMASTHHPDLPPLEEIWLESPEIDGSRVNIGPLTDIALDGC